MGARRGLQKCVRVTKNTVIVSITRWSANKLCTYTQVKTGFALTKHFAVDQTRCVDQTSCLGQITNIASHKHESIGQKSMQVKNNSSKFVPSAQIQFISYNCHLDTKWNLKLYCLTVGTSDVKEDSGGHI